MTKEQYWELAITAIGLFLFWMLYRFIKRVYRLMESVKPGESKSDYVSVLPSGWLELKYTVHEDGTSTAEVHYVKQKQ